MILGEFIRFESLTLVPYEPKLIDFTLMNPSQIEWFNEYNQKIMEQVVPRLKEVENADTIQWITERTKRVDPWFTSKQEL